MKIALERGFACFKDSYELEKSAVGEGDRRRSRFVCLSRRSPVGLL